MPASPAGATGGSFTLGLEVHGTLTTFPCGGSCRTNFSGLMQPSGVGTASTGTIRIPGVTDVPDPSTGYIATFAMSYAVASGWADYNEPATPLCPGKGTAAGYVTAYAPAEGIVRHASNPTALAEIDAVSVSASFTYDRVGSAAAIIARGSMRVYFRWLATGADGYFDQLLIAAGPAVFNVNAVQAAEACLNSGGQVDYQVSAEVAVETHKPYTS